MYLYAKIKQKILVNFKADRKDCRKETGISLGPDVKSAINIMERDT